MSTQLRIALVGAALVAGIVGGALMIGGGGRTSTPAPTPSDSRSSSPSPSGVASALITAPGALPPGAYTAQLVAGRLGLTLPAGWSSPQVTQRDFTLHRLAGPAGDTMKVFFDMRRASKDTACTEAPEPGVLDSARAIADDLSADPNLVVSSPAPFDEQSGSGLIVDVQLASATTRTCPFSSGQPSVPLIVDMVPGEGAFWGIGPGERIRLVLLDAAGGHNIVVAIDSAGGSSFEALAGEAMPIVRSFAFESGGPAPVCVDPAYTCAGLLPAATYPTTLFQPAFTFTVPSGWTNGLDRARSYFLTPPGHTFDFQVMSDVAIPAQLDDCGAARKAGAGTTVADWVGFLTTHPGLTATKPVDVTIGGYAGKSVSFHRSDTWTKTCPQSLGPAIVLVTDTATPPSRSVWIDDHYVTFTIVDVNGTTVIFALLCGPNDGYLTSANRDAKPVLDSIEFDRSR
jgi:hypothetical protein